MQNILVNYLFTLMMVDHAVLCLLCIHTRLLTWPGQCSQFLPLDYNPSVYTGTCVTHTTDCVHHSYPPMRKTNFRPGCPSSVHVVLVRGHLCVCVRKQKYLLRKFRAWSWFSSVSVYLNLKRDNRLGYDKQSNEPESIRTWLLSKSKNVESGLKRNITCLKGHRGVRPD